MRILVTGANGFLGAHVVQKLSAEGHDVRALVHNNSDALTPLKCEIVRADLLDEHSLFQAAVNVDIIVHVAGAMASSSDLKERQRLFDVNVEGVKNIIRLAHEKKCRLIHISSVVAVGVNTRSTDPLLTETSTNMTIGKNFANYDSKRIGEELVLEAARNGEITACVLNPGLIYGAGDARKLIRKGNIKAAKGKLPFYTAGGVNIVHVDDVVAAILSAMTRGRNGERYLITGDNITIKELLTAISEKAGAKPPQKLLPTNLLKLLAALHDYFGFHGEVNRESVFSATSFHWYDHRKAEQELNFHPRHYKEAIADSVRWMKENHLLDS